VIHFAARKSVPESVRKPAEYFQTNLTGTINLVRSMLDHQVGRLVFSSSCSIYGDQYREPISERDLPAPTNPYARSKLICEQVLADACAASEDLSVLALRYFNPAGAHRSGLLGDDPAGAPGNLMPLVTKVAAGLRDKLTIYGTDYGTPDGSAVRDYVHVLDVARAHRIGLQRLHGQAGMRALNVGTGDGASVLELVDTFRRTCGVAVPYEITGRRPGDVASLVADPGLMVRQWGWQPGLGLAAMCRDAWRFQQRNRITGGKTECE